MRKILLLLLIVCTFSNSFSQEKAVEKTTTTFYLINHAEKKPATEEKKDPYLNEQGVARAKNWGQTLSNIKLDDIYANNSIGSKQTAQIIAESQKLTIYAFDTEKMYDTGFKYNTDGKNILIVGNTDTTTKFANSVLGTDKYISVKENNFGNLYIITIIEDAKNSILLNVN